MELFKNRIKTVACFLTALLLFQSCIVYHKTPTTLESASQERIKTKVISANGQISKFDHIAFEDGQFYGVKKDFDERGKLVKTPLGDQEITKVVVKNKSASTLLTIGVVAVPVAILVGVIAVGSINYSPW